MAEKKILIADYDQKSLDIFSKLLKSRKYQLIMATDGQSAYDKFKNESPDVVILEAMLPKLHGFDLTRKIVHESEGRVPVIIVTGLYRGPQFRNEAISNLGAAEFFEKPVDPDKLLKLVNGFFQEETDLSEELPDSDRLMELLSKSLRD
jgi:DNA-binding response OmpR family regulator